jgi:hypothetical protein
MAIVSQLSSVQGNELSPRLVWEQRIGDKWRPLSDDNNWAAFWIRNTGEIIMRKSNDDFGPVVLVGHAAAISDARGQSEALVADADQLLEILFEKSDGKNREAAPGGIGVVRGPELGAAGSSHDVSDRRAGCRKLLSKNTERVEYGSRT